MPPDLLYSCRLVWGTLVWNFKSPPHYIPLLLTNSFPPLGYIWGPTIQKAKSKTDIVAPLLSRSLSSETCQTPQDVFLLAVNGLGQFRVLLRESAFDQLLQGLA